MYSRRGINLLTLIFATIIFILLDASCIKIENMLKNIEERQKVIEQEQKREKDNGNEEVQSEEVKKCIDVDVANITEWEIIIPKLDLIATIKEGVSSEVINKTVGHFEQTSLYNGNIGLAAHNRGYAMNFFQEINQLIENDIIVYRINDNEKKYAVKTVTIIKDTDFSYLEQTEDNRITLITCVKNNPEHRICVQAVEIS